MHNPIRYLNTDLDLVSADELTPLAAHFESRGAFALHVSRRDDGLWHASFELDAQHDEPEPAVAAMLAIAESLEEPLRSIWTSCSRREFDIGYDCGDAPWGFQQRLSSGLLARMAAVGASLGITLYPPVGRNTPDPVSRRKRDR